jgi:ethanolamine permease
LPYAGGPYAYVRKELGKFEGYLAGVFTVVEFLFAASAVTISINSYLINIFPDSSNINLAAGVYLFFLIMHIIGIKNSAIIELIMTGISISALILFIMGTYNSIDLTNILIETPIIGGYNGIIKSIPYTLWFYLCIEGISLSAEETKNPSTNMKLGFRYSILTVSVFNFIVVMICLSSVNMKYLLSNDYPLYSVLKVSQPNDKVLLSVFSFLALISLFSCLNGMINGYSRQIFSLSRAGYLPKIFSRIHSITKTPYLAILVPGIVGIILSTTLNANNLIFIASIASISMFIFVIHSYTKLKENNFEINNKYKKWKNFLGLYMTNAIIVIYVLYSIISKGKVLQVLIFSSIIILYYFLFSRRFIINDAPEEMESKENILEIK